MRDPLLGLPGAVANAEFGVAAHFGSPLSEQRALELGDAVLSLGHRGIIRVSGPDRLSWLNSMTSQSLTSLSAGESTETLLLSATGRIEHAIRVVDDGAHTWLLVDEEEAEALAAFLTRMRFALRVEVNDLSLTHAAVATFPGAAAELIRAQLAPMVEWQDPWARISRGGVQYTRGEHPGESWAALQFVLERAQLEDLAALIGEGALRPAGLLALDALEVRAARPSRHGEVDDRAIPHEFDWMRSAVHLTKGCYRGQETIAKVHNLGHPPRRLTLLHLDGSDGDLPVGGALVFVAPAQPGERDENARPVGRITRSALHHEWGGIALALLKRSVSEDAELEVRLGGESEDGSIAPIEYVAATQEVVVPADAGATRDLPKLKRL